MPKVSLTRATHILKLCKNSDQDFNIAITGARGTGKSTLMIQFIKKIMGVDTYDFYNHHVYSRAEFEDYLKNKPDNYVIGVDEAVGSMFKREWQDKNQIELMKILNMYRDKGHITFLLIPHFFDLDSVLRNSHIIKWWIYVYGMGEAVVYKADNNPFTNDVWNLKENWKLWEKAKLHKSKNYLFNIVWGELEQREYKEYKRVKAVKRKQALRVETKEITKPKLTMKQVVEYITNRNPDAKGTQIGKILGINDSPIYEYMREIREQNSSEKQ